MPYYAMLMAQMDRAMEQHPRSTVAMVADTFEILASGRNVGRVAGQMRRRLRPNQLPVVFQRPKKSETWIL
jgi:hypothetical protein